MPKGRMLRILIILSLSCRLDLSNARPAEESTRLGFDNGENDTNNVLSSTTEQGKELPREASNNVIPIVTLPDKPSVSLRSLTSVRTTTPIVLFQPVQRETVRLENDNEQAIFERPKPDNIRQALNSFLNPTPIVDRIKEEEKYGNMGDKFAGFSRAIVNAYESLSNFLNTVVDFPVHAAKQTSRGITETLNHLGARLVGLQ
ncbi:uncharacterized protein LOC105192458 [Harpegnathos saltator]|uniref:uncharacterized protein LOC105192458 n=1 Tax=Harpegnathos saltator TaxID=610380 RepID=UPI00058E9EC1|nr:uncharacterized protein LOC105192458 [Harpegnathos saltator]